MVHAIGVREDFSDAFGVVQACMFTAELVHAAITIEARNEFESFAPMELAANRTEVAALIEARAVAGKPPLYLLFTEPRELPVRMQDRIPVHWADAAAAAVPSVSANVTRGEYFTWQLAVFVPCVLSAPTHPNEIGGVVRR